jgi:hypothetical protein
MRLPTPEPCEKGEQLELKLDNIKTGETVYQVSNVPGQLTNIFHVNKHI